MGNFRCCFAPPSVRNLRSSSLAISRASPLFSWTFSRFLALSVIICHFQSYSITFSCFNSVKNSGIYWQPEGGGKQRLRSVCIWNSKSLVFCGVCVPLRKKDTCMNESLIVSQIAFQQCYTRILLQPCAHWGHCKEKRIYKGCLWFL